MDKYASQVDFLPNGNLNPVPEFNHRPWFRTRRVIIFVTVFFLSAAISLTYTYSRPAIYRSSASLLTSAMTAIDKESSPADLQHVAIQKQILLSHELLTETLVKLKSAKVALAQLTTQDIERFLTVEPVPETNLVEIRAEGSDPDFLPLLVNTWLDVYLEARAEDIKKLSGNTAGMVEDELSGLNEKISQKRAELEAFRIANDISSIGREENAPSARLNGITESLNKASEDEVKARANLDAIRAAIARGQAVVPERERGSLQDLERRLHDLQEKLAEFDKRFTRDYLNKQPSLKIIPEQIKKLEAEIKTRRDYGKDLVITEAENQYAAAQQTVKEIRGQLAEIKNQMAAFTTKFTEHDALQTDLEGLEKLSRDTQERLVQVQTSQKEKYPQVSVINRAYRSADPISPDYNRDALISLVSSILLGLFAVWIVEYLTRKPELQAAGITLSGVHVYGQPSAEQIAFQPETTKAIEKNTVMALPEPTVKELSSHQLRILLKAANLKAKQLIALLLSGLTLEEAAALIPGQIDLESATLTVIDESPRTLGLCTSLITLFSHSGGHPAWDAGNITSEELATILLCAVVDSGLSNPEEITAEAIRHSYIAYLVRQGLRLSDLEEITGYLAPTALASYSSYSPPQKGRGIEDIELLHPALVDIA